ncbi:response regulator receiver modulated diguanylate cyclase [Litoreibacter meonggei]|uniref:diguanylate cyclase n=1 Tax=Litoreibacter meonggei TaxID=1049199 RepID=A0A497X5I2_9RHOB|nr:diguanylate cyclase [Litoreibacter meonggei]RLJ60546.1 response regulator receiver modulated diguanylate cyclase [Litoreibacter meonggei]
MAGRILIVDPVPTNRMVLKVKLSLAHYDVSLADGVQQARAMANARVFDVVLASSVLVDRSADCVLKWMRTARTTKGMATTFIVMRDQPNSTAACKLLRKCLLAGADDVLNRPFAEDVLLARIQNLMRDNAANQELHSPAIQHGLSIDELKAPPPPANVAIALVGTGTPSQPVTEFITNFHKPARGKPGALNVEHVPLSLLTQPDAAPNEPNVVLLVAETGAAERALSIMSQMRSHARTKDVRVIVIQKNPGTSQLARAFELGAHDAVPLDIPPLDLVARINSQAQIHRSICKRKRVVRDSLLQAITDPLTGLYNRRYAASRLIEMQRDCLATGKNFAILAFDVDHFKGVNDRYGHAMGDAVLTTLAQTLRKNLRDGDLICRTGGEEFLVALPHTNEARARTTANRLRRAVGALDIAVKNSPTPLRVTVSVGLSIQNGHVPIQEMMEQADRALYRAKACGRNLVAIAAAA